MTIPENFKSLKANCLQIGEFDCHWSLFTPVIVIGCITVISITYYEEVIIGRLLYQSKEQGFLWYRVDTTGSLNLSQRLTVLVTCSLSHFSSR
jgi:hypothetical protein